MAITSTSLEARRLSPTHAQEKAAQWMGKRMRVVVQEPTFYIANAEDGKGFVILAANEGDIGVLGYSTSHAFPTNRTMPCALSLYLDTFSALSAEKAATGEREETMTQTGGAVEPLCTTSWGQGAPYNLLCPQKNGQTCPSGCVATAMAQLLYYWQWPKQGKGYNWAKDGNGETHSGSLEHIYNWAAMKNTTAENRASDEAAQAVATLMYDCGLSVNMNYDTDGSGARTPIKALYTHFSYIPTTLRLHYRECYTEQEWLQIIKNEIDHKRVIYHTAASQVNAGKDAAGHAFLVDGYDENGNIHVNWGWDGDFNGYYAIARMFPGAYQFTLNQTLTVGIEPARNGEMGEPVEYPFFRSAPTCSQTGFIQNTTAFTITVGNIYNPNATAHSWQLSIGIFDIHNEMLGEVKTGRVPTLSLQPGYMVGDNYANISCKLSGNYPDGLYALRVVFRESGTTEWILPDMAGGLAKNAVYVTVKGNKIEFTDGAEYIATAIESISAEGGQQLTAYSQSDADALTRVYDTAGHLVYSAPSESFNLWSVPARGLLIVKQGSSTRKVVR